MVAIAILYPGIITNSHGAPVCIASVPVMGFIIHQAFRLCFEVTGGFARRTRKVVGYIAKECKMETNKNISKLEHAFMVWESSFYSDNFPSSFREHDRGTWHYVLSFWSIAFAACLALFVVIAHLIVYPCYYRGNGTIIISIIFEVFICICFYAKGNKTYNSLIKQEVAMALLKIDVLTEVSKKIESWPSILTDLRE